MHTDAASQAMAPGPPQADWNTAFQAQTCQYDVEQMQFESAGCVTTHASNSNYPYCTHKDNDFQSPNSALVEGDTPTNCWQMDQENRTGTNNCSPLGQPTKDDDLSNAIPEAWELGPRDMQSMFIDYCHDGAAKHRHYYQVQKPRLLTQLRVSGLRIPMYKSYHNM